MSYSSVIDTLLQGIVIVGGGEGEGAICARILLALRSRL